MTARERIRAIVDQQLVLLEGLSARGGLGQDDLDRLQSLTKTARLADGLEVPRVADPTDDLSDAELEKRAHGGG